MQKISKVPIWSSTFGTFCKKKLPEVLRQLKGFSDYVEIEHNAPLENKKVNEKLKILARIVSSRQANGAGGREN